MTERLNDMGGPTWGMAGSRLIPESTRNLEASILLLFSYPSRS